MYQPLADKIRPKTLDDVVGQRHLLGENGLLRRVIESGSIPNLIFYGPSGDKIDKQALLEEKLGHALPISYEDWLKDCHYEKLDAKLTRWLYQQERGFVESLRGISLEQIALQRIEEFTSTLKKYIL